VIPLFQCIQHDFGCVSIVWHMDGQVSTSDFLEGDLVCHVMDLADALTLVERGLCVGHMTCCPESTIWICPRGLWWCHHIC